MKNTYLSDEEVALIKAFVNSPKTVEAVRKVLLATLYDNGTLKPDVPADPTKNWALSAFFLTAKDTDISDEALGQSIRSSAMGISMLQSAFQKLVLIGSNPEQKGDSEGTNQAR